MDSRKPDWAKIRFKAAYSNLRLKVRGVWEKFPNSYYFPGEDLAERWQRGRDEFHAFSWAQRAAGFAYLKYRSYGGADYFFIKRMQRRGLLHMIAGGGSRYSFPPHYEPKPRLP
ncbi:MAG: hypothetical protein A3J06_00920 [Candidatus Moranbacteria bacterium RIFCSPLOWO2_02_FULL_48_19]|nr:MAG: hypothetical protein A3J06_00920 [Candidatus Moranbacteria bacterium RIFCSPLOWO2_02_FULL_48_19]OGI31560.1 MAG: hypothetical protein A3G09_04575 [Candidatus Moranbacteria bacterium RIFCSPLOWO2_12_FULL_48_12]